MNLRRAPVIRVVGGLSLALLCAQIGLQLNGSEWDEAPPPSLDDVAAVLDEASPATPRAAPTATPLVHLGAVAALPASCGSSCSGVAAPVELSWGTGHVAAAAVSAPPAEEAPPARGADVAIAFAQAAAQAVPAAAAPVERTWPAQPPVLPARPGSLWIEPVVSALFDPEPAQPTAPATDPLLPVATPPQDDGSTPMAVPLGTQANPEGLPPDPLGSAGTPFKRNGLPNDKASGRAPVPLAAAPVFYAYGKPRGTGQGGVDPLDDFQPGSGTPAPEDTSRAPDNVPEWILPVGDLGGGPDGNPGHGPGTDGQPPAGPPAWLPLLNDTPRVIERIATGAPQPGDDPLLSPRFEPVALAPGLLVAAALVSEPGSLALLALATLGLAGTRRARRR